MNSRRCIIYFMEELADYKRILELQHHIAHMKIQDREKPDVLLILEHNPVFTIGKNGKRENLLVCEDMLKKNNINIFNIQRGGDITYHGPGQIVTYPIFDIKHPRIGVKEFVYLLEEVMIKTASEFGVEVTRNKLNRGVWYNNKKIGSIGIAIKRGITYHGLALNAKMDTTPFSWINPCGLQNIEVSTLATLSREDIDIIRVKKLVVKNFIHLFKLEPIEIRKFRPTEDVL